MVILIRRTQLVTVKVDYFIPQYRHLINEFLWQTDDFWPDIPRVHKFLLYWKDHIDARINNVYVQNSLSNDWRTVDHLKDLP